jgi:hypothetical protein
MQSVTCYLTVLKQCDRPNNKLEEIQMSFQSTLEVLVKTSAIPTGNFPEKIQLLDQRILKGLLFHKK